MSISYASSCILYWVWSPYICFMKGKVGAQTCILQRLVKIVVERISSLASYLDSFLALPFRCFVDIFCPLFQHSDLWNGSNNNIFHVACWKYQMINTCVQILLGKKCVHQYYYFSSCFNWCYYLVKIKSVLGRNKIYTCNCYHCVIFFQSSKYLM